ncbi:MAG TPA: alpha/beta hydrolase [Puia sp.]|nr:alpha/beta hydrolase [Puia sp.]
MDTADTLSVNGGSLFVHKEGQGEAIVFMHGFGLDHRMWENQVAVFSRNFVVITYDLRGFGRSAPPENDVPYSHEADYLSLIRYFDIRRAHLVGLSLGGRMALRCALTCPDAVSSLVLLDSALDGYKWSAAWQTEWQQMVDAGKNGSMSAVRALWSNHSLFTRANQRPALRDRLRLMIDGYPGWHMIHKDPAIVPKPPAIQRLCDIKVPALVVSGEYDIPDFLEIADRLAADIPAARRLVAPEAGHMVNMEAPEFINGAILEFLSGCGE